MTKNEFEEGKAEAIRQLNEIEKEAKTLIERISKIKEDIPSLQTIEALEEYVEKNGYVEEGFEYIYIFKGGIEMRSKERKVIGPGGYIPNDTIVPSVPMAKPRVKQYRILNESIKYYKTLEAELNECLMQGYEIERIDHIHLADNTKAVGYIIWLCKYVDKED